MILPLRLLLLCIFLWRVHSAVIISELMYEARQGAEYDFVELYNDGASPVDVSGWSFTKGITFSFQANTTISPHGYAVLVADTTLFSNAYGSYTSGANVFVFTGKLDNKGENLELSDNTGKKMVSFKYSDGWNRLASGFGSSLEIVCPNASPADPNSWRASPSSEGVDQLLEFGGSPGKPNSWTACPAPLIPITPKIMVSEILYHPYKEQSRYDLHEFIEFYNDENQEVDLSGWRLVSDNTRLDSVRFAFPAGSTVAAKSYFIVAKNAAAFRSVYSTSARVFGDYAGELKNGGDLVLLVDSNGIVATEVEYEADFPYPVAADGYGTIQHKGYSLERVSFGVPGSKSYNWVASFPTPGVANSAARDVPLPAVTEFTVSQGAAVDFLLPFISTQVSVKVSPNGTASAVKLQYYMEDLHNDNEPRTTVAMTPAADSMWTYNFASGFASNTIVRFRILADVVGGQSNLAISPRQNDPYSHHNFFITPTATTASPTTSYHLFIRSDNWAKLWYNLNNGTTNGIYDDTQCCKPNDRWNQEQQAILGYKSRAYDVEARYQGSGFNRMSGSSISNFPGNPPAHPNPVRALSWKIKLPDYVKIDSREELYWFKPRDSGCSFATAYVMYNLGNQLGLPSPKVRFARIFINGHYYLYAQDQEYYSSDLIEDYIKDVYNVQCRHQSSEEVGILFKAGGHSGCFGALGMGGEYYHQPMQCPGKTWSTLERTMNAYGLDTHKSWAPYDGMIGITDVVGYGPNMIDFDTQQISAEGKAWLSSTFDVNMILNYLVLVNWAGAWDDLTANHMFYQRLTDGKWALGLWDMDSFWGREAPCKNKPTCSLNLGEYGADVGQWQSPGNGNVLKNAFIKAFRAEYQERFRLLAQSVLSIENIDKLFDEADAAMNKTDIAASPTVRIDATCISGAKAWHKGRHAFVAQSYGNTTSTTLSICPSKPTAAKFVTSGAKRPGQPAPPTAVGFGGEVSVQWFAPNNWGTPITSYTLQKSIDGGAFSDIYTRQSLSYVDSSPGPNPTYRVRATSARGSGSWSFPSVPVSTSGGETATGQSLTTGEAPLTTGISAPVTTSAPAPITTNAPAPITTEAPAPITTEVPAPITTGSAPSVTTRAATTRSLTTRAATTRSLTTNFLTTKAATTQRLTTKPLTTGSQALTTGRTSTSSTGAPNQGTPCEKEGTMVCISSSSYRTCTRTGQNSNAFSVEQRCGSGTKCQQTGEYIYCVWA
eukprot:TRINITY_DN683_c0_g1_i3.p1 TRINITY_DN683_c0_g1~~TRINITY_DN683_c0_g1_i3.p1  ORF type:complete len:1225 (-),score=213.29 TRINITY_DN683_c0_g1_i3:19-3693(-)